MAQKETDKQNLILIAEYAVGSDKDVEVIMYLGDNFDPWSTLLRTTDNVYDVIINTDPSQVDIAITGITVYHTDDYTQTEDVQNTTEIKEIWDNLKVGWSVETR